MGLSLKQWTDIVAGLGGVCAREGPADPICRCTHKLKLSSRIQLGKTDYAALCFPLIVFFLLLESEE